MPGGRGKIKPSDNPRPFAENDPRINRNGPPKKLVSGLLIELKGEGYEELTERQVSDIISVMLNCDRQRIEELAQDPKQPIYITKTAKRLVSATDKEIGEFMDKLLDRAHGKSTNKTQFTGPNGGPLQIITTLSPERIDQLLDEANGDNTNT